MSRHSLAGGASRGGPDWRVLGAEPVELEQEHAAQRDKAARAAMERSLNASGVVLAGTAMKRQCCSSFASGTATFYFFAAFALRFGFGFAVASPCDQSRRPVRR